MGLCPPDAETRRPPGAAAAALAVLRHELRQLMYAPLTYIFMTGFVLSVAACVFLIADFYSSDVASVRPLLVFLPWVALIFVPALAMRAWVDDSSDRSLELTLTLPIGLEAVVAGKFLAGYTLLLLCLAFTAPLAVTVLYLGEPDVGVLVASYIGSALVLACFHAIALFAASFAREQVGAFVLGVAALFMLLLLGWDAFAQLLDQHASAAIIQGLATYSPKTWLDATGDGLVEASGLVYLVCVVLVALSGAAVNLRLRLRADPLLTAALRKSALAVAAIAAITLAAPLAALLPYAVDFTEEGEFTLHQGTLTMLEQLPAGSEVTLYWSAGEPSVPVAIKSHARRVERLLERLTRRAGGRLTFRNVDPRPDSDDELRALADGLRRVPMTSGDRFFLGATVRHGQRLGAIPYFDIRRDRQLEYDVAVVLNNLGRPRIANVGVLSPLLPSVAAYRDREGLTFMQELKRAYDVTVIPFFHEDLPPDLDILMVLDASVLRRGMLYAIDQFVMAGGRLIVMVDPHVRFNRASNQVRPQPSREINDISDLLLAYGIRYLGEQVVGDAALAAPVAGSQQTAMSYPYWLRVTGDYLSDAHAVTASLNEVLFAEPGSFTWNADIPVEVLVTTSERSAARARDDFDVYSPEDLALEFQPHGGPRNIVVARRGPLQSAYRTEAEDVDSQPARPVATSAPSALVLAVADVDWLFDPFALQRIDVAGQVVVRPLNDNLALLLNIVEYASGDETLLSIRSRGRLQRPFVRVAELFSAAEARYRDDQAPLVNELREFEERIARLVADAQVQSAADLPREFRGQVEGLEAQIRSIRKRLRDIRRSMREEVESLGRRLTVANLLAGPILVLLTGLAVWSFRRWRIGQTRD